MMSNIPGQGTFTDITHPTWLIRMSLRLFTGEKDEALGGQNPRTRYASPPKLDAEECSRLCTAQGFWRKM